MTEDAKVQLYCNAATSEVTGEHPTLHEAIGAATSAPAGALLMSDGVLLATSVLYAAVTRRWLFEQAGIERLHTEYNASLRGSNS